MSVSGGFTYNLPSMNAENDDKTTGLGGPKMFRQTIGIMGTKKIDVPISQKKGLVFLRIHFSIPNVFSDRFLKKKIHFYHHSIAI